MFETANNTDVQFNPEELNIFDRWGTRVFSTRGYIEGLGWQFLWVAFFPGDICIYDRWEDIRGETGVKNISFDM